MYADYFLLTIFSAFNQAFNQYISMKDPNCTIFKYIYINIWYFLHGTLMINVIMVIGSFDMVILR